mmetsp:Transcript_20370/g.27557  ORF Transcript_20370/g.27557 Transcript_20370/m.27557 type:complete len:100 (+) Transcript_20370:300-599(+)
MSSERLYQQKFTVSRATIDFPFSDSTQDFVEFERMQPVSTPVSSTSTLTMVYFEASKEKVNYGKECQRTLLLLAELGGLLALVMAIGWAITRLFDCQSL